MLSRAEEDAVPVVDLSMVEQRHDAVKEVLDGAAVKAVATRASTAPRRETPEGIWAALVVQANAAGFDVVRTQKDTENG